MPSWRIWSGKLFWCGPVGLGIFLAGLGIFYGGQAKLKLVQGG